MKIYFKDLEKSKGQSSEKIVFKNNNQFLKLVTIVLIRKHIEIKKYYKILYKPNIFAFGQRKQVFRWNQKYNFSEENKNN